MNVKIYFVKHDWLILHLDLPMAESIFSNVIMTNPHCADSLDNYSNVLYVLKQRPKLALLAQLTTATDRFRPETCCVVGNYYSRISEHEKAVTYFQRALILNRSFASAWTLLGHEYIELKNTHAALESYRRAVDLNRKDYRAWHGLGHTYDALGMFLYALSFHRRAVMLRPDDPDMWHAMGMYYSKLEKPSDAIKALKQSLALGNHARPTTGAKIMDPEVLYHIAQMYEGINDRQEAVGYMELCLAEWEETLNQDRSDESTSKVAKEGTRKARLSLARMAIDDGDLERAYRLAKEVGPEGVEGEEAKSMFRDFEQG